MEKHPHILNAASNLLGISLVIIAGLNVSKAARTTVADEIAWISALFLSLSCIVSYAALRSQRHSMTLERAADYVFLGGLLTLFAAVAVLAFQLG
jgi:hypothetical protein